MIFDLTKSYVPESYVDSRDYRTFLRQLGTLLTVFKYNIDHFPDLYDPSQCLDHMLPLLASMVGYKYKDSLSIDSNRKIVEYFPYLLRNRGSELGIRLAVALSLNTSPNATRSYSIANVVIEPDVEKGLINIYYPQLDLIDWDLIEAVRPVGMRYQLIQSDMAFLTEELSFKDRLNIIDRNKYYDQSVVGQSTLGYSVNDDTRRINDSQNGQ